MTSQWLETHKVMTDVARLLGFARLRDGQMSPKKLEIGCSYADGDPSKLAVVISAPHGAVMRNELYILERPCGVFSAFETLLSHEIAVGVSTLWQHFEVAGRKAHIRMAVHEAAILIGISRLLRARTQLFWAAASVISLMQSLTFKRYEGQACTSGFICLQDQGNDALESAFSAGALEDWRVEDFGPGGIPVDHRFFENAASYRYVDGMSKYYVLALAGSAETPSVIRGTVELRSSQRYSLAQRASFYHVNRLVPSNEGFAVLANRNSEVDVVSRHDRSQFLRWSSGAWHVVNMDLIAEVLSSKIEERKVTRALIRSALTLSFLRKGTLILVPEESRRLPQGTWIDESSLGKALRKQLVGLSIERLVGTGQFIAAFSSDGLTAVGGNGEILDTGRIIANAGVSAKEGGGARTAAARVASKYGIVIKVSADGPISLYKEGKCIYATG